MPGWHGYPNKFVHSQELPDILFKVAIYSFARLLAGQVHRPVKPNGRKVRRCDGRRRVIKSLVGIPGPEGEALTRMFPLWSAGQASQFGLSMPVVCLLD